MSAKNTKIARQTDLRIVVLVLVFLVTVLNNSVSVFDKLKTKLTLNAAM